MSTKTKNTQRTRSRLERRIGVGVFLLVILGVWLLSWKLFKNVDGASLAIGTQSKQTDEQKQGDSVVDPFAADRAYPVAVMLDNAPEARPYHVGLSKAAVVYETLAEGGSTRLMLVFAGAPDAERIGPIRSARPYFVETAAGWSSFYWHAGGSPEALEQIPGTDVVDLNEISGLGVLYFWRDNSIARPHNLFSDGKLIALGIDDFGLTEQPEEKLHWLRGVGNEEGDPAAEIYVDMSEGILFDSSFSYDAETHSYPRSMAGVAHVDQNTGEQLAPRSVIVQRVPAEGYYPSGYGRVKIKTIGEGDATFFANGVAQQIRWEKEDADSQTRWLREGGELVSIPSGQVWVVIVPGDRSVTYE